MSSCGERVHSRKAGEEDFFGRQVRLLCVCVCVSCDLASGTGAGLCCKA